jgi:hypothetical protein
MGDARLIGRRRAIRRSRTIVRFLSDDLLNWRGGRLRSALPGFVDGFGYDVSVIDPIAVESDGILDLFLAAGSTRTSVSRRPSRSRRRMDRCLRE